MFSSFFSFMFTAYVLFVWLLELLNFLGFYSGFTLSAWLALPLAGGLCALALSPWIKGRRWKKRKISLADWAVIVYFGGFVFLKSLLPDLSEDTCKYHIFLQEPSWKDMISFHVFPGGMQGFVFPLGDRLFYLFRRLLGYRLGTVWNLICLIVLYVQARCIIERLSKGRLAKFGPLFAFTAVAQYDVLMQMGSYMVELAAVNLFLEGVWMLVDEPERKEDMVLFAGLSGLLFAMKMTNIIYVIPLLVLYIWKNRAGITAPLFAVCFLTGALPVSIYLIHNWVQTANPVYPYYNALFQSPYYGDVNFKDLRWGGWTFGEKLLWPLQAIVRPEYRKSELPAPYTWGYGAACVLGILGLWRGRRARLHTHGDKDVGGELALAGILILCSSWLWSFSTGHVRYYMGGFVILVIWGICGGACFWGESMGRKAAVMAAVAVMLPGPLLSVSACLKGNEWSLRLPLSANILPGGIMTSLENKEFYKEQFSCLGRDRVIGTREQRRRPDKMVILGSESSFATLVNPQIPIESWGYIGTIAKKEAYMECAGKLEEELRRGDNICCIMRTSKGSLPDLSDLYEYRFSPKSVELLPQNLFPKTDVYLVELESPPDPENKVDRQRPAAVITGKEPVPIGQVPAGEGVSLVIETPGLKMAPGMEENSLTHVTLQILAGRGEEKDLVKELDLNLTERQIISIDLKPQKEEQTYLYGLISLDQKDIPLGCFTGVWIRTSLTGRQYIGNRIYWMEESGLVGSGKMKGEKEREYLANHFGEIYGGWADIGEDWYYLSADGSIYTGWLAGKYFMSEDGVMVKGSQVIDGVAYEFDENGRLKE